MQVSLPTLPTFLSILATLLTSIESSNNLTQYVSFRAMEWWDLNFEAIALICASKPDHVAKLSPEYVAYISRSLLTHQL